MGVRLGGGRSWQGKAEVSLHWKAAALVSDLEAGRLVWGSVPFVCALLVTDPCFEQPWARCAAPAQGMETP